ncbi:hypothetical protein PNEG_01208 [Pneumocystis murina B123]|uniref:Uncharacterized protein n=1 Tax=Pneumocystis murina (strain B123) TaxID=1069680 RepID=M7NTR0_PNEMU|nr:hypothetical protein PNEG_01208 [Pneumocystis murina B123]EMR10496.1 hypothetical protein PNEG_01208 [Pneumocystis murina B123]
MSINLIVSRINSLCKEFGLNDKQYEIDEQDILQLDIVDEVYIKILKESVTKILALSSATITNFEKFTDVFHDLLKYFKKVESHSLDSSISFYDFVACSITRHYSHNVISKISLFSGTEFQKKRLANHIHNLLLCVYEVLNGIIRVILEMDKVFDRCYFNNIDNLNNCIINICTLVSQIILILFQTYFSRENSDILNTFLDIKNDSITYIKCIELMLFLYDNSYLKNNIRNIVKKAMLRCFDFKGFDIFLQILFKTKDSSDYDDIVKAVQQIYDGISKIIFRRSASIFKDQKFVVWGLLEYIELEKSGWTQIQYNLWLPPLFISSWLVPNERNDCEIIKYCYKLNNQISREIIDNIQFKIISSSPELSFQMSMSFIFSFQLDEVTSDQNFIIKRIITLLDNVRRSEIVEQMNLLMVSKYQCLHFFTWLWESSLKCPSNYILAFSDDLTLLWLLRRNFLLKYNSSIVSEFEHLVIFVLTGGKIDSDQKSPVYERGCCKDELDRSIIILKRQINFESWLLYLTAQDVKSMFVIVLTELLRLFKELCSLSILVPIQEKNIIEFVLFIFLDYDRQWIEFQCWNNLIYFLHSVSKEILMSVFTNETLTLNFNDNYIVKKDLYYNSMDNTSFSNSFETKTLKLFSRIMHLVSSLIREFEVLGTSIASGEYESVILNNLRKIIGINQFLIIILIYLPPDHLVNQYACSQYEFISLLSSSIIDVKYISWFQTTGKFLDHLLTIFVSTNLQLFAILSRQGIDNIDMPNNLKFSHFIEIMIYSSCRLDVIAGVILDLIKIYKNKWTTDSTDVICLAMTVIRSIRFFDKCETFLINKINDTILLFKQTNDSKIWEYVSSDIQNMEFLFYVLKEILHGYLCVECFAGISSENLSNDKKYPCKKCILIPNGLQLEFLHLAKLCIPQNAAWIVELKTHLLIAYLQKIYDIAFESKIEGYEVLYQVLKKIIPTLEIKKKPFICDDVKCDSQNEIVSSELFKLLELDHKEQILAIIVL